MHFTVKATVVAPCKVDLSSVSVHPDVQRACAVDVMGRV
jgi:hypothetical protein